MKKIYLILVLFASLNFVQNFAQSSSAFTVQKAEDRGYAFYVELQFTLDSVTALASNAFTLPENGTYNFKTNPITYHLDMVHSNLANPFYSVFLQSVGITSTDTVAVDTLINSVNTEVDSVGVLTVSGSDGVIQRTPAKMKIFIRGTNDASTGRIMLVFPKVYGWKP